MKSKEQKQDEAKNRQVVYDNLAWQEKLDKLNYERFVATKERDRNGFSSLFNHLHDLNQRWGEVELDIATMEDF